MIELLPLLEQNLNFFPSGSSESEISSIKTYSLFILFPA
jgi:hypothetical protein